VLLKTEAAYQILALLRIGWVFVLRAGDPAFRIRHLVHYPAHGADEGLDVLDRYDAANQAENPWWIRRAQLEQWCEAGETDPVRDIESTFRR
jgi:hypothetical protein